MLDRLTEVKAIVVWHADRLHRQPIELEHCVELVRKNDVKTHAVKGGETSPRRRACCRPASLDSLLVTSRRTRAIGSSASMSSPLSRVVGGEVLAPLAGMPWTVNWCSTPRRPRWSVRQCMMSLLVVVSAPSSRLHRLGVERRRRSTTGKGSAWTYATLRQILMRPRNAGLSVLRGEIADKLQAQPIVNEDVWRAVCFILKDPSRRRSQNNKARHLLAGIAQCHCGNRAGCEASADRCTGYRLCRGLTHWQTALRRHCQVGGRHCGDGTADDRSADAAGRPTASLLVPDADVMETAEAKEWMSLPIDDRRDFVRAGFNFILLPHRNGSPRVFDRGTVLAVPNHCRGC
jgi:hypothetical protein